MTTVAGSADDDSKPQLTRAQTEAIRRALSDPALHESMRHAQRAFNVVNRQISASVLTGMAPALEEWRRQQRQVANSILPLIAAQAQTQVASILAPLAQQISESQRDIARQLSVVVQANTQLQNSISELVFSPDFTEALRRINSLSAASLTVPTEDGFTRLSELIDDGQIDEESIDNAEQSVRVNEQLSQAIDAAAIILSRDRPMVSRKRARQLIVIWVWFMWAAATYVVAVVGDPLLAALPGAAGVSSAPATAKKAGELFDKRFPPDEED